MPSGVPGSNDLSRQWLLLLTGGLRAGGLGVTDNRGD